MNKYKAAFFGLLALMVLLIAASVVFAQNGTTGARSGGTMMQAPGTDGSTTPATPQTTPGPGTGQMGPGAMGDGHGPGMMGDGATHGPGMMGDGTGHGPGAMGDGNWQQTHETMGQNMPEGMQQTHDAMSQAMQSGDPQQMHDACQNYWNMNNRQS